MLLRSLHSHDFSCSMDIRNELVLFVYNIKPATVTAWHKLVHNIVDNFETGDFDDFNGMEERLLSKIKDARKRKDAKNLSRQRVRELLMRKCDVTCRRLEREWCEAAWLCTLRNQIVDIYRCARIMFPLPRPRPRPNHLRVQVH